MKVKSEKLLIALKPSNLNCLIFNRYLFLYQRGMIKQNYLQFIKK